MAASGPDCFRSSPSWASWQLRRSGTTPPSIGRPSTGYSSARPGTTSPSRNGSVRGSARSTRSPRLANPAHIILWNADKNYLPDLAHAGVPTIETVLIEPGEAVVLPAWDDTVVKPSVSGGARLSGRFGHEHVDGAHRLIAAIHAEGKTAMLQPYAEGVDVYGEANVLMFGGMASHAVTKGSILAPGFEPGADDRLYLQQSITPLPLDDELVAFADRVLTAVGAATGVAPSDLLHARVDSAVDSDGVRRLMEVELIEPFLYLHEAPDPDAAALRYAEAIAGWLDPS